MIRTETFELLTRIGFAGRGLLYMLIGYMAFRLGRAEDAEGALELLGRGSGRILLIAMAAGFAGYAVWRLINAWQDGEGHGSDTKGIAIRLGGAFSGLIHAGLAYYAIKLAAGAKEAGGGTDGVESGAASALSLPGGWMVVVAAAGILVVTALVQFVKAWNLSFLRHLDPQAAGKPLVQWTGRLGYAARGIIFLTVALFLWRAGQEESASKAGGMGEALAALPESLGLAAAAGLFLFGIFSLVEARYRRIAVA